MYRLAAWLGIGVMGIQRWQFDVVGEENIPASGGALICANHQSFWDFFAVAGHPFRSLNRPIRIMAKKSMFEAPLLGRLFAATGCIPVDRMAGEDAFRGAIEALQRGELVLIMPEGTISRSYDLLEFRLGAARIALAAGVPMIPAASWGTHRFYTSKRRLTLMWKLPVAVRYGKPFIPSGTPVEVTEELQRLVANQLDDAVSTYADGTPQGAWWLPARLGGGAPPHDEIESEWAQTRSDWRNEKPG